MSDSTTFTVEQLNELLNNYLQGKDDGRGSIKVKNPIDTVLNGAKAKVTKLLHNTGSETQFNDDTTIAIDENNAALLEITISGTLSTKGIDNENEANKLKSTGNYKRQYAVPPYVTAITDIDDPKKRKFQSWPKGGPSSSKIILSREQ